MNTVKNIQIAREYNVSSSTVTRWIGLCLEGKNNLQLFEKNGKHLILDNPHNRAEITRLVEEGKKYRSNIDCKRIDITDNLSKYFTEEEIIEIAIDLKYKKQFTTKYSYKIETYWDEYYINFASPLKTSTNTLLKNAEDDIFYFLEDSEYVNIIDIGPGNGYPVKNFLEKVNIVKKINKYVAIDISEKMNKLCSENIRSWFPKIAISSYERDIESAKFGKLFLESKPLSNQTSNVILHLGNTMCNHNDRLLILKNIRSGMVDTDLFIFTFTLNTHANRGQLNYIKASTGDKMQMWPLEVLGLDVEKCEVIVEFDDKRNCKSKSLKLDKDYEISVNLFGKIEKIELYSGQLVNIWRHHLIDIIQIENELRQAEMQILEINLDKTGSYAMIICKASNDY